MAAQADWTPFHARIHRMLRQRQLLPPQSWLLVAVSGGQDSLCLLKLLLDLQPKWHWSVAVAHCNHRWRSDADANAEYIRQLAAAWQFPFYGTVAPEPCPTEAAAREWRYQVLAKIASEQNYGYVVTGHTASDRTETLLYNLMRGSGADGLQALAWQRPLASKVQLVRPLLEITRAETAAFCQQNLLQIWEDSTNHDLKFARNRIRHELIPYLQTHFNPRIESTLAQTAELLRSDVEYLEMAAEQLWQQVVIVESNQAIRLNRTLLRDAPLALQRRVIRLGLKHILSTASSFEQIEKLAALLSAPNRSQTDPFPGGAIAWVQGDWIWLGSKEAASTRS
ncbi:MAG: tRNA lysidine(34) synthetase TilS [Leptolyngbya sp. IPPAS B-1204]|nr:tRNA lysidine(34) synthetase TilS [Elainella sp. C42_A2020_010]RNJ66531.1 MAG: tRNA lysidine(34) synthetase TilS [Leptolyngbya sp. IPPAS B-1204]